MASVGRYLAATYGHRLVVFQTSGCLGNRICPDSALAADHRRALVAAGELTESSSTPLPQTCDKLHQCRYDTVDGAVAVGEPIVHGDIASIVLRVRINGPHGQPAFVETGTLTIVRINGAWVQPKWVIHTYDS